uniref:Uncharacterized protein n=1 Tax=Ixodes ricinus TaxID=34613 RepID=A0A6B0UAB1_IXORI
MSCPALLCCSSFLSSMAQSLSPKNSSSLASLPECSTRGYFLSDLKALAKTCWVLRLLATASSFHSRSHLVNRGFGSASFFLVRRIRLTGFPTVVTVVCAIFPFYESEA